MSARKGPSAQTFIERLQRIAVPVLRFLGSMATTRPQLLDDRVAQSSADYCLNSVTGETPPDRKEPLTCEPLEEMMPR